MNKIFLSLLLITLGTFSLSGCGDDKSTSSTSEATTAAPAKVGKPPAVTGAIGKKPKIAKPSGDPPTELIKTDIKKGTGKTAKDGDKVTVQYEGIDWTNGAEFDASWNNGQPFSFTLGAGEVIPGWDQGVKGMKVGGRRELVIPPDLAYGPQGSPPAIGPDETLVFVVDLEKVQ